MGIYLFYNYMLNQPQLCKSTMRNLVLLTARNALPAPPARLRGRF